VAALLDAWGDRLGLPESDRLRWRAAGHLHDALKDAPEEELRVLAAAAAPGGGDLPPPILHGPACAARLEAEGVRDRDLREAIAWHSTGHPSFGLLGRFLYLADFLEPGRTAQEEWRAALRERATAAPTAVLQEVLRWRIENLLRRGKPVALPSVELWNRVAAE
jgi:HD superfamily phosphohydrolase YqeK